MLMYDLCCCEGGVTRAAQALGFRVIGVDNVPQPLYPGEFILADALKPPLLPVADLVWCSPPCQSYSRTFYFPTSVARPKMVNSIREVAQSLGTHYVIENVSGCHDLIDPIRLCGAMFGLHIVRHRLFETSFFVPQPKHVKHLEHTFIVAGHSLGTLAQWREAMGLFGMSKRGLAQAVPFAYTWFILTNFINSKGGSVYG